MLNGSFPFEIDVIKVSEKSLFFCSNIQNNIITVKYKKIRFLKMQWKGHEQFKLTSACFCNGSLLYLFIQKTEVLE